MTLAGHHYRGVTFILQAILFRVVPTALEISLVCGILVRRSASLKAVGVDVCVDVQVWLGLCRNYTRNYGCIYVVYCTYYGMAVSSYHRLSVG
jgi:hypothetical protein